MCVGELGKEERGRRGAQSLSVSRLSREVTGYGVRGGGPRSLPCTQRAGPGLAEPAPSMPPRLQQTRGLFQDGDG